MGYLTITSLTTEKGKHAYIDISHETPTDEQWEDAQQFPHQEPGGEAEVPSTRKAKKTTLEKLNVKKRTVETRKGKRDITTTENTPIGTSSSSSSRARPIGIHSMNLMPIFIVIIPPVLRKNNTARLRSLSGIFQLPRGGSRSF